MAAKVHALTFDYPFTGSDSFEHARVGSVNRCCLIGIS